jgi:iron complex outermembrane receptor protein
LGSRNRFLDNRVQINLELFYWLYKDHQEGITTLDDSGAPNFLVLNAGKGRMYGFNVDLVAQPSGNDTIRATVEYLNAKYTDFVAPYAAFAVRPGINTTCPATFAGPTAFVDCSGFPLTRAPELTGSAGWTHIFDLGGNGELESDLNVSFSSDSFATGQYTASVKQPSWIKANASLTYRPEDGGWSVTGYVNNITNDVSASGSQFSTFAPPLAHWVVAPPRSYGLRLNVEF